MQQVFTYDCPLGHLQVRIDRLGRITDIDLVRNPEAEVCTSVPLNGTAESVCRQLDEYFARRRQTFDLPLSPAGTAFRQKVYKELMKIPYGTTVSYGHIARAIGQPRACQAVGQAVGSNPILILIPCHRVICADGSIGGFSSGLDTKRRLLDLEGCVQIKE